MAKYIAMQDHHNPLSQHDIASYVTKFESKSFRLRFEFWGSPLLSEKAAGAVSSQRLRQSQSQGATGSQTLAIFLEQVGRLLCCACASYSTENLLLSKESLFRQQAFGPSCANALVLCLLLH